MDEKSRIQKLLEISNKTLGQFSEMIGIKNSTLSHILNDRNKPSLDVLKKILQRFPEISSDWLILGQGPMYRHETKSHEPSLFDDFDENDSLSVDKSSKTDITFSSQEKPIQENIVRTEVEDPYGRQSLKNNEPFNVESGIKAETSKQALSNDRMQISHTNLEARKVIRITLYYSDNTFQEFESK